MYIFRPDSVGEGFRFGPNVSPVCLPQESYLYVANTNVTITGWGKVRNLFSVC